MKTRFPENQYVTQMCFSTLKSKPKKIQTVYPKTHSRLKISHIITAKPILFLRFSANSRLYTSASSCCSALHHLLHVLICIRCLFVHI